MKIFEHFNQGGQPCIVCGTLDDKETTLIGIDGTEDGGNMQALQVHVDCIELKCMDRIPDGKVFYQFFG